MRIALIATVAACLLAAAPSSAVPTKHTDGQLVGSVGPGFTISLKDASGAEVTHLDVGTYTLLVHDLSDLHNFHLSGPGVNVATDVIGSGDQTFTINVTDGVYNFECDAHPLQMKGAFAGGTATLPPTTTPPPPPPPPPAKARTLTLGVGPGKRLTAPASRAAGKYTVTVRDASATDDLHLKGPGVDRKTGVAFVGTVKWTVTLKTGTYKVFSDSHKTTLTRTLTVR
jgi:plastocyanin